MSDAEAYARLLLPKKFGYPLWDPEPFDFTDIYKTKGVRIGDVGYVTRNGGFETLFNIRAPAGHPINANGVPRDFEQVILKPGDIELKRNAHGKNAAIASYAAERREFSAGAELDPMSLALLNAELSFEYSWSEQAGAILHLPVGASRLECKPQGLFVDQAHKHAYNWYEFAIKTLHRSQISCDSLYLVTGCVKTVEWMVGTASQATLSSSAVLRAKAVNVAGIHASYEYAWVSSGPATYERGPVPYDEMPVVELDENALRRDNEIFSEGAPDGKNQCVFIKGLRISVRNDVLGKFLGLTQVTTTEELKPDELERGTSGSSSYPRLSMKRPFGRKGDAGKMDSSNKDYAGSDRATDDIDVDFVSPQSSHGKQVAAFSYSLEAESLFDREFSRDKRILQIAAELHRLDAAYSTSLLPRLKSLKHGAGDLLHDAMSPAFQASWEARTNARIRQFCSLDKAGNALCAWHDRQRDRRAYPPHMAPPGYLNCGCTYEETLFAESLARHNVCSSRRGTRGQMEPWLRNPLLKLLQSRYGYKDGDFERDPITGNWVEGQGPASWGATELSPLSELLNSSVELSEPHPVPASPPTYTDSPAHHTSIPAPAAPGHETRELEQECRAIEESIRQLVAELSSLRSLSTSASPPPAMGVSGAISRKAVFQASWEARTKERIKKVCAPKRSGSTVCLWHASQGRRGSYPPRIPAPGHLNCGCTVEQALFEDCLASRNLGSYRRGGSMRMDPSLRDPLLKLLQRRYAYQDGDFERDPITGDWIEGEGSDTRVSSGSSSASAVSVISVPESTEPYHPSVVINRYLLQKFPEHTIAVTHDDIWSALILNDGQLPEDKHLLEALETMYEPVANGVSFIKKEHAPSTTPNLGAISARGRASSDPGKSPGIDRSAPTRGGGGGKPVMALHNILQERHRLDQLYWGIAPSGPLNSPSWTATCKISGKVLGSGTATSKALAKEIAAEEALKTLSFF